MFYKKSKKILPIEMETRTGNLRIDRQSDLRKQIEMIGLTQADLDVIKMLQPFVTERIDEMVNVFYDTLKYEPSLLSIINDNSTIDRLKKTLHHHIIDMFNGQVDSDYIARRLRIAMVHVKIGLETKWYMCAFQNLTFSIYRMIHEVVKEEEQKFHSMLAVSKIMNLEQQLVLEEYDKETARLKEKAEEQKRKIGEQVAKASQNLAAISEETNASFYQLKMQVNNIGDMSKEGSNLANMAKTRAEDGKIQVKDQAENMKTIDRSVDQISSEVMELSSIAGEMKNIVSIVNSIAEETNLLSLNAAIEASRAGQSGKGFAVVAGEVRKLSDQTKISVSNVSSLIQNTQTKVNSLLEYLQAIRKEVDKGNKTMTKTEENFERILATVGTTMSQNDKIETELTTFLGMMDELGLAVNEVSSSADELNAITQEL